MSNNQEWARFLNSKYCEPDQLGNRPCDNGCACDLCKCIRVEDFTDFLKKEATKRFSAPCVDCSGSGEIREGIICEKCHGLGEVQYVTVPVRIDDLGTIRGTLSSSFVELDLLVDLTNQQRELKNDLSRIVDDFTNIILRDKREIEDAFAKEPDNTTCDEPDQTTCPEEDCEFCVLRNTGICEEPAPAICQEGDCEFCVLKDTGLCEQKG